MIAVQPDFIRMLDGLDAYISSLGKIEHGFRIGLCRRRWVGCLIIITISIPCDSAPPFFLIGNRRFPRLVDVFAIIARQFGDVFLHEFPLGIPFLGKSDGAIAAEKLRVKRRAGEPLPITRVAGHFVIDQPFGEHVGAAFPVNVAASTREKAGHGVAAKVVNPAFVAELAHQCVDPRKARAAEFPAPEPFFSLRRVDGVFAFGADGRACAGVVGGGCSFAGEVPGDEAAAGIIHRLAEGMAKRGLGAEIHVAEEQLSDEVCGDGRRLRFFVSVNDGAGAVVKLPAGERAEVEVRREKGGRLRGEGRWRGARFGEGSRVFLIGDNSIQLSECHGLSTSMSGRCGLETQLGKCRHGKIPVRTR